MNVETKFNVGDNVYYIHNNQIQQSTVNNISINIERGVNNDSVVQTANIIYLVGYKNYEKREDALFATPEDLFKSLKANILIY